MTEEKVNIKMKFQADIEGETVLKFRWQDTDYRGLKLFRPFFGLSVNGGRFIDVKDIVEVWEKREDLHKPNNNNQSRGE